MSRQQDRALDDVRRIEKGIASGSKRLLKRIPLKYRIIIISVIFGIVLLSTLVSSLSIPQADKTFNITSQKESKVFFNRPLEDEKQKALWEKDFTIEQTQEYLEVIAEFEQSDQESLKGEIIDMCSREGYDAEETLSHLDMNYEKPFDAESKNSDTLIKSVSLDELSEEALSNFNLIRHTSIKKDTLKLLKSDKKSIDKNALLRYDAGSTSDYIVAMPSSYGKNGARFKAELDNGKTITLIKAASSNKSEIITFIADYNKLQKKYKDAGNVNSLFGKLKSLSVIESEFSSESLYFTTLGESILAAFSVYMDNGQTIKEGDGAYVNQDKKAAQQTGKKVNYTKHLKKILKKATSGGSHLYAVDYERDDSGNIMVREVERTKTKRIRNKDTGEVEEVPVSYTVSYVCPVLSQMKTEDIAKEIFGLDPDAPYVNSGGIKDKSRDEDSMIDIRTAIDNIAKATDSVLFEKSVTSDSDANDIILSGSGGTLEWPSPGYTTITSYFGYRIHPIFGTYKGHEGLDIGVPMDSKIVAAESGTITYAGTYGGYGNYIQIDHGNGFTTAYGHLNSISVSRGQKVVRGQVIARSGSTGWSTGPHLHFEVRKGGALVDPLDYTKKK